MLKIIEISKNINEIENRIERMRFEDFTIEASVTEIVKNVKSYKDEAVRSYTKTFDGVDVESLRVTTEDIEKAYPLVNPQLIEDLIIARQNIEDYHRRQMITGFNHTKKDGVEMGQIIRPITSVGIYVPGGTAQYPSTVLMNAVPAKIAGCKKVVMITPPQKDGSIKPIILAAAKIAGVDEIYKVGGAQGIAALAFGTESIPKVDKIVGPGNMYVAMAKKMVSGYVGIDMIAGPSEVLIIADDMQNPDYIASDLMAQAEHDTRAIAILLTTSMKLAEAVNRSIETWIQSLDRKEIIEKALRTQGFIGVVDTLSDAVRLSNLIAPEHLEIMTENPKSILEQIEHAGSIFLGAYTPEPVGDYIAGPNHTLPTSGTARFSSGLSVLDFIKKSSYIYYTKEALEKISDSVIRLSDAEGLSAHGQAIKVRRGIS